MMKISALSWLLPLTCLALAGCGNDEKGKPAPVTKKHQPPAADGGEPAEPPVYALSVIAFGPDPNSDMTYVSVFDSLDITSVDLKNSYPFPGDVDIAAYDGKLFVSDGESPNIIRFGLDSDGKLNKEATVSFANLGVDLVGMRDNIFISSKKAYMTLPTGQYAIWNPQDMTLGGTIDVPDVDRDGMVLDGSPAVLRGNHLYRSFYWEDWSTYTFSTEQYIGSFDTDSDTFLGWTSEQRCPNLGAVAQKDESGNLYFSNWFYNVPGTLMKNAPKSCVVRIPSDSESVDPDWTLTFSDVTGGHEGAQLSYIADGKGVFAAFHEEDFTITKDTAPYEIPSAVEWEAWGVDLDTKAGQPISGMDRMIADQTVFTLDGRTFLLAPGADWETSTAYELKSDGSARKAFPIDGWSRGFVKIR
ncbi:MAG TPA: hypothetical protein VHC69_06365 [Polyangiaceae bacterium]|nr:hypothetical protein [Polyangiaceae bacterium]